MILRLVLAILLLVNGFEPRQKVTCYQKFVGDSTRPSDFTVPPSRKKRESSKNETEYIIHHSNEVKYPGARMWTIDCLVCVTDNDCDLHPEGRCMIHPYMKNVKKMLRHTGDGSTTTVKTTTKEPILKPKTCCEYNCRFWSCYYEQRGILHNLYVNPYCKRDCSTLDTGAGSPLLTTIPTTATEAPTPNPGFPTPPLPPASINTELMMKELLNCVKYKLKRSRKASNCNQVSEKLYKECASITKDRFGLPLPQG